MWRNLCVLCVCVLVFGNTRALGDEFTYQGEVRFAGEVVDDICDFQFRLYDADVAGNLIGVQVDVLNVAVAEGRFSVDIDFGAGVFGGGDRWIEIDVLLVSEGGLFTTLAPRQKVQATPVAQIAKFALDGNPGPVGPEGPQGVQGNVGAQGSQGVVGDTGPQGVVGNTGPQGPQGVAGIDGPQGAQGVQGDTGPQGTAGSDSLWQIDLVDPDQMTHDGSIRLVDSSDDFFGISLVTAWNTSSTGSDNNGVFGLTSSDEGSGVHGKAWNGAGVGVFGEGWGDDGIGVRGLAFSSTGINTGGYFQSSSISGRGVYGLASSGAGGSTYGGLFESRGDSGAGVRGIASSGSGVAYGGYFQTASNEGRGVQGYAEALSGLTYGVLGWNKSASGRAVYGYASATSGVNYGGLFFTNSISGFGVYAQASSNGGTALKANNLNNSGDIIVASNGSDIEFRVDSSGFVYCDEEFLGGGADYAEWLERSNPNEVMQAGQVVGVRNGKITKDTRGAQQIMVISTNPVLVGNHADAEEDTREGYEKVAFIGQVPVQVVGVVNSGDFILASGYNDGTAVAVARRDLTPAMAGLILGSAWESSSDAGVKMINCAIGIDQAVVVSALTKRYDKQIAELDAQNAQLQDRLSQLEAVVVRMAIQRD